MKLSEIQNREKARQERRNKKQLKQFSPSSTSSEQPRSSSSSSSSSITTPANLHSNGVIPLAITSTNDKSFPGQGKLIPSFQEFATFIQFFRNAAVQMNMNNQFLESVKKSNQLPIGFSSLLYGKKALNPQSLLPTLNIQENYSSTNSERLRTSLNL